MIMCLIVHVVRAVLGLFGIRIPHRKGPFFGKKTPEGCFDVLIVGGGPAGSTCGFYLKRDAPHLRVGIIDKDAFPRDKICGDAFGTRAVRIMNDMGILEEMIQQKEALRVSRASFVSPAGIEHVGDEEGASADVFTYSIQRRFSDVRLVTAAVGKGVELMENTTATSAVLDKAEGLWTIKTEGEAVLRSRYLIIAEGVAGKLCKNMGIEVAPEFGAATRRYYKGESTNFHMDAAFVYATHNLPGYIALLRHANGDVNVAVYVIPGGSTTYADLPELTETAAERVPYIAEALGSDPQPKESVHVGMVRAGGCRRSYGDHYLLVGDIAGHCDPLTGMGIDPSMRGGVLAARTVIEMFERGCFGCCAGALYHWRWMHEFGFDFFFSKVMARSIYRFPILLDALTSAANKRDPKFMEEVGAIMTGAKPKWRMISPRITIPVVWEIGLILFRRVISMLKPKSQ